VVIGEIRRPHGLRGAVRVAPLTDHPERFATLRRCIVWEPVGDVRDPRRVLQAQARGAAVVLTLEGSASAAEAAALAGRLIAVPESEALPPGPGRFYPWQLEGARVRTEHGREIGRVVRIETTPAHDLWVVQGEGREHLIPAVPAIVVDVDIGAGRVVIRPPDGLLDL
jgi:16S rRNA processing protein RimM